MIYKEYIICSAIKIIGDDEIIVCGRRHNDCISTVKKLNPDLYKTLNESNIVMGFITSRNEFKDRNESYIIAKRENQFIIPELSIKDNEILTSEDLFGIDY